MWRITIFGWLHCLFAVIVRPWLWPSALGALVRFMPSSHVPPDADGAASYLQWRMLTAYGDSKSMPRPHDLVEYLEWTRMFGTLVAR